MNSVKISWFWLFLLSFFSSYAQVEIKGTVKDSSNIAVEFANVMITNQNNKLIAVDMTDKMGQFKFLIKTGNYKLAINSMGYKNWTKSVAITKNMDLGNLILIENKNELDEVVVYAHKKMIEQKADRMVFNVQNSPVSVGGNAIEALEITPGVRVKNDAISIVGKQGVKVMVNDRMIQLTGEDLVAYLASIASDDIKSIEVITAPPSKYAAEGNSGLINIQLKKTKINSWNNNIRTAYIQTTYPAVRLGNTFSYNKGKIQLMAAINDDKGNEGETVTSSVDYASGPWTGIKKFKNGQDLKSARIGFDYDVSKNTAVGFIYSGTASNRNKRDVGHTKIFDTTNNQTGGLLSNGDTQRDKQSQSINTHYIQKLDTLGRKLSVNLNYLNYKNNQNRVFDTDRTGLVNSYFKANNISNQDISNYNAKIDVEHPFSWGNISYGTKISFTETDNIIKFYNLTNGSAILDSLQSDNFKYKQSIAALYLDYAKSFGKKWQVKAGFRVENTKTNSLSKTYNQVNKVNYTKIFPTLYLTYTKSKNNVFNVNYSKRIDRPKYWELNPFRWYINSFSYAEGNPYLRPEFSNNFEFKHIYKSKLTSKIFFTLANNGFGQIPSVNQKTNQQIFVRKNYYNYSVIGLEENFLYSPFRWWNIVSQATIYNFKTYLKKGVNLEINPLSGLNFSFYNNHTLFFNKDKTMQANVTFLYSSPQKMLIYKHSASVALNMGLKFLFLNKKLQCSILVKDIFKSLATNNTTYTNNIKQEFKDYPDNRYLKVGVSYKFGNQKIRVKHRNFGNEEEKNRTN